MSTLVFITAIIAVVVVIVWNIKNDNPQYSNLGTKGWLAMKSSPEEKDEP